MSAAPTRKTWSPVPTAKSSAEHLTPPTRVVPHDVTPLKLSRGAAPRELLANSEADKATAAEFAPQVPWWPHQSELVATPPGLELESACSESGAQLTSISPHTQNGQRSDRAVRILAHLSEALATEEAASWQDRDGYIQISKLLRVRPELQRDAFGSTKVIQQAIEQGDGAVRLDQDRKRVRLQTEAELIRSVAEQYVSGSFQGAVPISDLQALPAVSKALVNGKRRRESEEDFLRRALLHEDCQVTVSGSWVARRPRRDQLQRVVEELFSDAHLAQDQRLRSKVGDMTNGEVPLTWLCSKYSEWLGGVSIAGARAAEVTSVELCEALRHSEVVDVDARRLTVKRKVPLRPVPAVIAHIIAQENGQGLSANRGQSSPDMAWNNRDSPAATAAAVDRRSVGAARAVTQLRQLLDFYFEPFTLQHNRYLLDLLARKVGPPVEAGPWVAEALLDFCFGIEDLNGLGRISSALSKLRVGSRQESLVDFEELCQQLKHLRSDSNGQLQLRMPPEIRSFVTAPAATPQVAKATARYLTAAKEQRGQAPSGMLSVLSYAVSAPLTDQSESGQQRISRVKRQLTLHHADVVCLQGLDADGGAGAALAAALSEEGYGFECARRCDGQEANTIFWDRTRLEVLQTQDHGAAIAVDLKPFEDPDSTIRIICMRPSLPTLCHGSGIRHLFDGPLHGPSSHSAACHRQLVCVDFSLLGGAEASSVVEELAGLPSVCQEVLGGELIAPLISRFCEAGASPMPMRSAASGLNRLHSPDAVLFRGMSPVVALSGHTEGYLATMSPEDLQQQFPAFRMPIVAAFDFRSSYEVEGAVCAPGSEPVNNSIRL